MTIRTHLNKVRAHLYAGAFISWLGGIALFVNEWLNTTRPPLISLAIIFALFIVFNLALVFGIRCPRCRNALGDKLNWPGGSFFSFSTRIKYCPFCSVAFDAPLTQGTEHPHCVAEPGTVPDGGR